jgi:hypothetical protein
MAEEATGTTSWTRSGAGVDASPQTRPGVPMYAQRPRTPQAAEWSIPPRQAGGQDHLKRAGLQRLTPVFGTANPPHGVAGALRRVAYGYPEDLARRWMMLLLADRLDVVEDRLGGLLERPLQSVGFPGLGRRVHRNPFGALAAVIAGAWLAKKVLA